MTVYVIALTLLALACTPQQSFADDTQHTFVQESASFSLEHQSAQESASFSQDQWAPASSWEANEQEDMEKSLLEEIEDAFGVRHSSGMKARITENEEGMRAIYQSLTKNEYDKLSHPSVRYLLHRYFVQKHGWFIDGLFHEGQALNSSSPIYTLKDRVPMYVQGLFEKRLGGRGFGLRELAVLVSVVESSVHQEAEEELKKTYKAVGVPLDTTFTNTSAKMFVEKYMTGYILNRNMSKMTSTELHKLWREIPFYYPTWPRARKFFNKIRIETTARLTSVQYANMVAVIDKIVDNFGIFMGRQCQDLKNQMTALEKKGSVGCVSLTSFYGKGLKDDSNWLFVESPDYLRHIGALDETDPQNPQVLTSNYMYGPNSCLQPSGYYMVCCHNECDDILGHLERRLASPSATPKEIILALPAGASSGSLRANSKPLVPQKLIQRLNEVADHHEGQVPLHGRLFAQWLHHMYPRECPYPHLSGTRSPEWMDDFESETGRFSSLTGEEMTNFLQNSSSPALANKTISADKGSCAPWEDGEELFAPLTLPHRMSLADLEQDPHLWRVSSSLAFAAVVATMTISATRMFKTILTLRHQPKMLQV